MQSRWRAVIAAAGILFLFAGAGRAGEPFKWQTSFSAAKAAAKKSHKLIMADFFAEW